VCPNADGTKSNKEGSDHGKVCLSLSLSSFFQLTLFYPFLLLAVEVGLLRRSPIITNHKVLVLDFLPTRMRIQFKKTVKFKTATAPAQHNTVTYHDERRCQPPAASTRPLVSAMYITTTTVMEINYGLWQRAEPPHISARTKNRPYKA